MKIVNGKYLVIDDDHMLRERLVKGLVARGADACGACTLQDGLTLAGQLKPDRVILDLKLPDGLSLGAVKTLKAILPESSEILMLTGFGAVPTALSAVRAGAINFLTKPATLDEIISGFEPNSENISADQEPPKSPTLDEAERNHIDRVLESFEGNVTKAAAALGIHRRSLQRKLAKLS